MVRGQVLIELLVAIGTSVILIPAVFSGFAASREGKFKQSQRLAAVALAEEGLEGVRVTKEADWNNIATNGTYHPEVSGNTWVLVSGSDVVGDYTRTLTIADVYRDANSNISDTPGTLDPSTKKITSTVTWTSIFPATVTLYAYMTRLTNDVYVETTVADFEAGLHSGTSVTNLSGGEVQLGGGGNGDWCSPDLTIAALDLPRSGDALALTAIEGQAFVGTGADASGVSFAKVDITDTDPPVATSPSTNWFNGYKTNDVFGETGFAYIATDTNSAEILIISLTTSPYSEVGSFNSPGPTDGNSVFVLGNVGFMTAGSTFYTFDLTAKTGNRAQLGSVSLAGTGTEIYVVGTYAYVSISGSSTNEMQIIDVSSPSSLSIVGSADTDSAGGSSIYVNETGTRAYLATGQSSSQSEMFIIDVSTKTGPRPTLGSYETNGMDPKGVRVVPGNRAIIVGHTNEEYQVINIVNETAPFNCGGLDVNFNINGVWSVIEGDGDAYSYIITEDANNEFRIIEGGPGGAFVASGTFTSQVFDAGEDTAFNRFLATFDEVPDSSLRFQMGVGDAVGGVCDASSLTYVGPDGTSSTFFDDGGLIPFDDNGTGYENPGRCFAYRVFFEAPTGTPIFYDITINYSP